MTFEQFAHARDFFYFAALLLGAGAGCILNRFRRTYSHGKNAARFRNRSVTAGLCFFSGALAAATVAAIYSNWAIFSVRTLYIPLALLALIIALAFRFPRAAGFPLVIIAGVFTVWLGYVCLRFPVVNVSGEGRPEQALGQVVRQGDGSVRMKLLSPAGAAPEASVSLKPPGEDAVLDFSALRITVSELFPLTGGLSRGAITGISSSNGYLYGAPRQANTFFSGPAVQPDMEAKEEPHWFIAFQEVPGRLEVKELSPGVGRTILLEGSSLAFR